MSEDFNMGDFMKQYIRETQGDAAAEAADIRIDEHGNAFANIPDGVPLEGNPQPEVIHIPEKENNGESVPAEPSRPERASLRAMLARAWRRIVLLR